MKQGNNLFVWGIMQRRKPFFMFCSKRKHVVCRHRKLLNLPCCPCFYRDINADQWKSAKWHIQSLRLIYVWWLIPTLNLKYPNVPSYVILFSCLETVSNIIPFKSAHCVHQLQSALKKEILLHREHPRDFDETLNKWFKQSILDVF